MTNNSQSHQFKLLLENKFAGVALWDKNKILTHMNDKVKQLNMSRKLQIGYNRAARMIDQMEENGIVSKASHTGKREVL